MQEKSIFTNEKDVVENLRDSAQNLGINPDDVKPVTEKKKVLVAKKNCKHCYGIGTLVFVPLRKNTSISEQTEKNKRLVYCKCVKEILVDSLVGAGT